VYKLAPLIPFALCHITFELVFVVEIKPATLRPRVADLKLMIAVSAYIEVNAIIESVLKQDVSASADRAPFGFS
jgi:hypothetical protein